MVRWDWVHCLRSPLFGLLYQPRMMDDDECVATFGIRIGLGNRSTRRKPATIPLCRPQIPHYLTRVRIPASAIGSRRLSAWATVLPFESGKSCWMDFGSLHISDFTLYWLLRVAGKKTPWPESTSEPYRPSNRRLSAKLVPIFADRGCHLVSVTDPYSRILGFLDRVWQ
jgi:hypothetical protein